MKRVLYTLLTLAVATSCVANGDDKGASEKSIETSRTESQSSENQALILTKGVKAIAAQVDLTESFTSEIEAYKENDITPAASGVRIDQILFDVGDSVKAGEVVARLDPTIYNQQMISLNNLKSDYERLLPVYEAGGISRQSLDQAKTAYDLQREVAANTKKNIELLSPISGVVTERSAEVGDLFSSQPIMHIAQIDKLKIMVNISEQHFPSVKIGMPVELRLDIYPDRLFSGRVSLIYPKLNAESRTFTVEVTAPNQDMLLRPGMYANTIFKMGGKSGVMIPDIAVQKQFGSAEHFVYVARNGTAERRRVVKGRQVGDMIDIVSGIEVGDIVLTTAFSRLSDGAKIEIKE